MRAIKTERLILRPIDLTDAPALFTMRSFPETVEFTPVPLYSDISQAEEYITRIRGEVERGDCHFWAICLKESPQDMIGSVCLWNPANDRKRYDIGYEQHPDFGGKGYMGEAVNAVTYHAFSNLGLEEIDADPMATNTRSVRLLEKCGFSLVKDDDRQPDSGHLLYRIKSK